MAIEPAPMMKLVVLMTLIAVAIGRPPPCDDYCRTMWFSTQLPPPWDPLCDCAKRTPKTHSKTFDGKPVYTATTIFKIDDTGIYFDPANMHQVDGVTYINQPFYIVNSIDEFLTKPPMTANFKATGGIYAGQRKPEMKTVTYKKKYNVNLADPDTHKSFSYSYRKEDVPKVKTDYKTKDQGSTEDLHKMEQSLFKCVDLYMMTVSRIYNNGSELVKIWGKSKYHKFSKLSDEDLIVTMKQECNEIEDFVKKSIEEIIDKQPKKKIVSNNEGSTQAKQNKPFLEPNYTPKTDSVDKKSGNYGGGDNFKTSELSVSKENNPVPIPPIDTSDASALLSDVPGPTTPAQGPTSPTNPEPKMTIPEIIPVETLVPNINDMNRLSMNNDKRDEEEYHYLNNITIYKNLHDSHSPDWVPVYDLKTAIEGDANKINTNRAIEKYPNSTITAQYKNSLESSTIISAKNRPTYGENEFPPQRVITREFSKDVVDSVINGTEDLQRDDSTEKDEEEIIYPLNSGPIGPPVAIYRNRAEVEMVDQEIPLLIGNLYFNFGEDYIPAKFVQKADGKLHVAIDGVTICSKMNLEGNSKFPVLSGLCDKFQNN